MTGCGAAKPGGSSPEDVAKTCPDATGEDGLGGPDPSSVSNWKPLSDSRRAGSTPLDQRAPSFATVSATELDCLAVHTRCTHRSQFEDRL
jgi:hypothetical protein